MHLREPQYREHEGPNAEPERSEEHTSELQSPCNLVCRLLLEKKKFLPRPRQHDHLATIYSSSSSSMTSSKHESSTSTACYYMISIATSLRLSRTSSLTTMNGR